MSNASYGQNDASNLISLNLTLSLRKLGVQLKEVVVGIQSVYRGDDFQSSIFLGNVSRV